ncbi:hypothetical protein BaRGS_00037311 [Batillaria attramentaria]|uniref:Uncharacterized protein n=1 Tax=Batillaria attramentaria TaxID=370345 RepID=A0ABD0J9A2_9CAEN|nr:hypothetical protein BaRGS_017279 [Batillaria attramentaria]
MDHEAMAQIVLYNPWARGHSWTEFHSNHMAGHPTLGPAVVASWKSFYDRGKVLMDRRKAQVASAVKKSGNDDEEKPSDFEKAVDDAIELAGGQEEPQKKKIKIDQATIDIREAAMDTENQRKVEKAKEPPASARRPSRNIIGDALAASIDLRKEAQARKDQEREQERQEREQERKEREREREHERKERERERKEREQEREQERKEEREIRMRELDLKERNMNLRERDIALREQQEKAVQAQSAAMLNAISTLVDKVKRD